MSQVLRALLLAAVFAATVAGAIVRAADVKDAEAATHGGEAARYRVVQAYQYPGFKVVQYDLAVLSHYSYMLVSGGQALVIDPGRDAFTYLQDAEKEKAKIVGVWLTHSHADFVAGHIEVASRLGVPIYISRMAGAGYEHKPLKEGDTLTVGQAVVKFLETPGHTPDSMCGLVAAQDAPQKALALFTGDTLFVGSVGRPDLLGEGMAASTLASMMYDTWFGKLSKLPDSVEVLPAHGAGSLCGAHLGDAPSSTIGQERASNPYLKYADRGQFVAAVLEGLPEAPQYFKHNAALNRQGPEPVDWQKQPEAIAPSNELADPSKHYVVDVRDAKDYAAGHVPNSINIALRGRLETWVGIMVPWDAQLVVAGDEADLGEAAQRLHRVGYRAKVLSMAAWKKAGLPLATTAMIAPRDLYRKTQSGDSPLVVDVRQPAEWSEMRIGTVLNLPLAHLAENVHKLDRSQEVVTVCNSAYRSMMAAGVLERAGFKKVANMAGGGEAWIEAGLPVVEAAKTCRLATAPDSGARLPDRLPAAELKRMLQDMPGTFEVADIRPPAHFADYRLPGSKNVTIADLVDGPTYLSGAAPLVIVDRDGSLAAMVGGILAQKTARPIKVLYGGLAAYWDETGPGAPTAVSGAARVIAPVAPVDSAKPQAAPPVQKPKKKSAGC